MRADELRALGELAGDAAGGVAALAQGVHEGVAGRVFAALGPPAMPVRVVHDRIVSASYAGARLLAGSVLRGGAFVAGLTRPDDASPLSGSAAGRAVVGALNGAWGDRLAQRGSSLQTSIAVCRRGREVATDRASVAAAFADATPQLAVFIHGLGQTDESWRRRSDRHPPYGDRLRAEHGITPVYVRYNSGLHISSNGRALATLIDQLVAAWPCEVTEIALIGHSMGALVARSACCYAAPGSWRDRVRSVFMLGAPHAGAPLERAANAAAHALELLPETRPFAMPLKLRAAGIKDLGHGYIRDEDWQGRDLDAFRSDTGSDVPFLTSADHYFVSATLSTDPNAPAGRLLGDLLVMRSSAWSQRGGRAQRLAFGVDNYRNLGAAHHFDLLNHPAVYAQLSRWIGRRALPAAV